MGVNDRLHRAHLRLLLLFTLIVMCGFAFPQVIWISHVGYTLIALLLTQAMEENNRGNSWTNRIYRILGLVAVVSLWLWLLTPLDLIYSGIPMALDWSILVGWSVIRLVKRLADEPRVSSSLLMGATAGYLHIGLAAGLVMSAVETIIPNSFEPLAMEQLSHESVLAAAKSFSTINYYAFVCLTTVGFGDITPMEPFARMLSVLVSIAGPLYLAVVMGVLIGRYASSLDRRESTSPDTEKGPY